ncbi:MAG TPA: pyridoxal phosphate-dependent aminotransferase [Planctomycetota bacterium]|nr:pyridoxal phosphate-dependent aminotransferase [Planctomycetota bacterium]
MTATGTLRPIPYMGVIWVVHEAMKLGFRNGHPDWCNLGQGQPEVGEMEGAPPRLSRIELAPHDHAYGPINGTPELRAAIAAHYNRLYRRGQASQYTAENVSVASGGRLALSRVFAALGAGAVGYQVPDYTAYEDLLDYHRHRVRPVAVMAREQDGFLLPPERLARALEGERLSAFILSNPCNPTGRVVRGAMLGEYLALARKHATILVLDEFYSHFIYDGERPAAGPVSGAAHVEDVERDPVLLVDGLTKSFRYPGWRVGWAVGPRSMIETLGCAASAIDGGPGQPIQRAALEVLQPARADQETSALRTVFSRKRNLMSRRLAALGVRFAHESESTFYVWGSIAGLPAPLNDAEVFFRRALERKVLTVPGRFFDINPGRERKGPSPLAQWMRFSFGPPQDNLELGLQRLEALVAEAR